MKKQEKNSSEKKNFLKLSFAAEISSEINNALHLR